ncbi:MAG: hypothetical protein EON49_17745 [Acidovorax sp.]|nr:MAG: hypothetical protein EON49_17745 [Acidovorax sp.]
MSANASTCGTAPEQAGTNGFVATHTLVERSADGQLISYAVLPRDVHTWLPTADLVLPSEDEGTDPLIVTMADFLEIAGSGAKRLPYVLSRYEVVAFPDAGSMARLRAKGHQHGCGQRVRQPVPCGHHPTHCATMAPC